jgi:hypothetical protein
MTNDESASGGRGREPNHDKTAGTAVARMRTVLAGVQDFRQEPLRSCRARGAQHPTPGNESMSAARARPSDGRDSDEESNATNAKDRHGLRGISGRVGNPQAKTGAPTEWDNEKAAYVAAHGATHHAAHGTTHHAAHGRGDRQGLPALRHCLVLPQRKISRGKPNSAEALPIFAGPRTPAQKEAAIAHGVRGGTHSNRQGLPALFGSTAEENFQDCKQQ